MEIVGIRAFRAFFTRMILISGVCILWASSASANALGEQANSLGEALEKANAYSFATGGIGIIMSYGTKNEVSAAAIGEAFVNELKGRGFDSRYYFYTTTRDGVALSFNIGYSSLGPWAPNEAAGNINQVTDRAKAAYKIHGYRQ